MRMIRGLTLSVILLLGLVIPGAAQEDRSIVTTEGADYFGFDLRTEKDVTLEQCKAACLDEPQCRAFTHSTKAQWCFLKSDFSRLNPSEGAVAGKVLTAGAQPDIGAPPALRFVPEHVLREAEQFREKILRDTPPGDTGFLSYVASAGQALNSGDFRAAGRAYSMAIAIEPQDAGLWTGLARAIIATEPGDDLSSNDLELAGTGAAVNAYDTSRSKDDRARALVVLANALERRSLFRPAISAYEASLELSNAPAVQEAYADLKRRKGFRVLDHSVDSDSVTPRVCVQFSEDLVKAASITPSL